MKKLKPPKGWRILKANEILLPDELFYQPRFPKEKAQHDAGRPANHCAANYGYSSCYIRKISKTKKSRPKKSLGQIAYEARYDVCDWNICRFKDLWQRSGEAVAKAVRRRMANKAAGLEKT